MIFPSFWQLEHLAFGIVAMLVWAWMWDNAEKLKGKCRFPLLLWLAHLYLAGAWVTNFLVGIGVK